MNILKSGAVLALVLSAATAHAVTTYKFTYVGISGTLSGQFTGTLQGDSNTVIVDSIIDFARWNARPGPSLRFVNSLLANPTLGAGSVTLDGSGMDLLACADSNCSVGFAFDTSGAYYGAATYASSREFGGAFEPYLQRGWSMSGAVPEPASWALMITGFGLVGSTLRRRRITATA